jgi:hypothetical protein
VSEGARAIVPNLDRSAHFLHWFNEDGGRTGVDDVLRAGLTHPLYEIRGQGVARAIRSEGSIILSLPQGRSGTVTKSVGIWCPSRN